MQSKSLAIYWLTFRFMRLKRARRMAPCIQSVFMCLIKKEKRIKKAQIKDCTKICFWTFELFTQQVA